MSTVFDLVHHAEAFLFDFDGPVCSVFSGRANHVVARQLRTYLEAEGVTLPPEFDTNRDPLLLLRWVGHAMPALVADVDDLLADEESTAVQVAQPTRFAHEALRLTASRMRTAIVSNNSARAIAAYLDHHQLTSTVNLIVGRYRAKPDLMKPAPDLVMDAVQQLRVRPESCLFLGDSTTDMQAGRAAGVLPIGYAKSAQRRDGLLGAGAALVIDDMSLLVQALDEVAT